ncbi:hypothetical protein GCM10007416_31730 [Kroppenstedtia guangzhouensis]|uniref:Uncharacterized protein n=1 Tax=Kroppenstedtia guangzhouensis TaxID=1274356 RepID=A0ABQ1H443_9BACL|nr:hypothetical protein [Kroppenstedtia guangzhouensis]GGA56200.1 hypothetical protein GCM10007416_31730 [Kroppenstedtia guangzhouensis]
MKLKEFAKVTIDGDVGVVYERPHAIKFEEPDSYIFVREEDGYAALVSHRPWYHESPWCLVTGHFHPNDTACLKRVLVNDIQQFLLDVPFGYTIMNEQLFIGVKDEETFLIDGEEVKFENLVDDLMNNVFWEDEEAVEGLAGFTLAPSTRKKAMELGARDSASSMLYDTENDAEELAYIPIPCRSQIIVIKDKKRILMDTEKGIYKEIDKGEATELLAEGLVKENLRLLDRNMNGEFTIPQRELSCWVNPQAKGEVKISFEEDDFVHFEYEGNEGDVDSFYIPEMNQEMLNVLLKACFKRHLAQFG